MLKFPGGTVSQKDAAWFAREPGNDPAVVRLIVIPPAGSGTTFSEEWQEKIPGWIDLIAVRLPGREKRIAELPYTEIGPLAHDLAEAIMARIAPPYAILGHCLGALIAFEVTRLLITMHSDPPRRLIVSGQSAPQVHGPLAGMSEWTLERLIDWLMRVLDPSIRADLRVVESFDYQPGPKLDVPISVLAGEDDPDTSLPTLLAWRELTSAPTELHTFPGAANFAGANLAELASVVSDDLRRGGNRRA